MIYLKICYSLMLIYLLFKGLRYLLTIFQQEHYSPKKLLKTNKTFYLHKKYNYIMYILIIISLIDNIYLYIIGIALSIMTLFINDHFIVPFKLTKRMVRLLVTYIGLLIISLLIVLNSFHLEIISLITLINPFYLLLCFYINYPLEIIIHKNYRKKAKNKLDNHVCLIKIAITGSYGKTSTKNILNQVLKNDYLTLATPKSYNTLMGICKTINQQLNKNTEIFICEMGAYRLLEIKEMSDFIKPKIAIITDIGYQHMETFKTIDNVTKAKCELADSLSYDGYLIINGDNEFLSSKTFINIDPSHIYRVGYNDNNDIRAINVKTVSQSTTFDIDFRGKIISNIETKLLGRHNIMNILFCYGAMIALEDFGINLTNDKFIEQIKQMSSVMHRLSYSKVNNIHLYDDSYNANLVGFKNSIEVLKNTPYYKIIITPGIVDCGKESFKINQEIATAIKDVFNEIYLIDNDSAQIIKETLIKESVMPYLKNSFKEAYREITNKYPEKEIALLIANDLPDNYLMRKGKNK